MYILLIPYVTLIDSQIVPLIMSTIQVLLETRAGPKALTTGQHFVFGYLPNLAGSSIFLAVFGACLLAQIVQGFRYKTWFFSAGAFIGLSLEIMSYVARLFMRADPSNQGWFLM